MTDKDRVAMEKRWQREDDARTLQRYEEIMASSSRKRAAMAEAKKQAKELQNRAAQMQKAATRK